MCGFAGIVGGKPSDPAHIEAVLASRGPDGRGVYETDDVWLLHRRLAVLDLDSRSDQPFVLPDGSVLVYNGELYNFRDFTGLTADLRTEGDTEIVAHLGDRKDALANFRGMYAYGLHRPDGTITLVRDRFGIKPLYVKVVGSTMMYASQLRCFMHELGGAAVADEAVASFLRFGSVVTATMYQGVFELPAGHTLTWKDGRIVSIEETPAEPAPMTVDNALRQSVRRHLVSDAPACLLLSSGLDSAVLAKLVSEEAAQPIDAVTLSVGGDLDEAEGAQGTADQYGLRLHRVEMSAEEAQAKAHDFLDAMDQPSIDGLNIFLLSSAVRDLGFKVALSGLGADELFGGYPIYRNAAGMRVLGVLPKSVLTPLLKRLGSELNPAKLERVAEARHDQWRLAEIDRELRAPDELQDSLSTRTSVLRPLGSSGDEIVDAQLGLYMRPRLLRDADAMSMACSVELRVPFLDDAVAAAALSASSLRRGLLGKRQIVDALDDDYLRLVLAEPKKGFDLPMEEWFDVASDHSRPWGVAWSERVLDEWKDRNLPPVVGEGS